ncbi:MAG: pyridoxal phosphate-dependent aminotransferase [Thermoanaerobaculia bacterium]
MLDVSKRGKEIQASPIRKLVPLAEEAKRKGIKVYHLNIGQPDIPTPLPILKAIQGFNEKVLEYGHSQGLWNLRVAISNYFNNLKLNITPENVLITIAGSEAIHFAFSVVADTGDEIIIPEPYYTNYNGYASFADVKIVPLTTRAEDGFHLPPAEEIEKKITKKTRAILLCSPNNPTGAVFTREEMEEVASLCKKHNLFLISDEVYREFAYDGEVVTSALSLKGMEENAIVVDSISKRFSSCGARIGCIVTKNKNVMESLIKFAQARLCPPTVEQLGAIAAYNMDPSYFEPIREEYKNRRDVMYEGVLEIEGAFVKLPKGAFYMIVKLPIKDSDHFASWLLSSFQLDGETVMVAPGAGFYCTEGLGKDEIRLAYVLNVEDIKRAMLILKEGLNNYRKNLGG